MSVPLVLQHLKVRSLDVDFHELSWEVANTTQDVLDYTFQILRSESPNGPYTELSQPFEDRYLYIDNILQIAHKWRKYYYKIRVTHKPSGDTKDYGPISKEPEPDLIALEIRRHMQILFREYAGRRCWVLPRRTFGQRCSCYDSTLQKRTRSGCRTCYDTGFIRGYMHPIEMWIQMDPSGKSEQHTNIGKQQQSNTTVRFGYYPAIKPQDLIIEPENRRWRVINVAGTEHLRALVHQEGQLHEIPPTDIEYSVPLLLNQALRDLWLSPSRAYTNPHNLATFEREEIPNIFNLYPTTYPAKVS